jgi:hypothetical protein
LADLADILKCRQQAQGRPAYHPSDHIRRAALALRDRWCNDTIKLARVALEAAAPDVSALLPLLEPPVTSPKRQPTEAQGGQHVHA